MFELPKYPTHRRGFLGKLAAAAALGVTGLTPLRLEGQPEPRRESGTDPSFEAWLNRIPGKKHRMVFDAPEVNGGMPVVWPRVWLNSNNDNYGTTDAENSAVIVLRHSAAQHLRQGAAAATARHGDGSAAR